MDVVYVLEVLTSGGALKVKYLSVKKALKYYLNHLCGMKT